MNSTTWPATIISIHRQAHANWNRFIRSRWGVLRFVLEITLVVIWAIYVGRVMLDRDPNVLNFGGDNVSASGRFFWDHLKSCGTCALWNGQARGGVPAIVDPGMDTFHPVVAIPALLVGTLQSFKSTIVLCLIMGGVACWWFAFELGTGAVARIGTGFMGAAGGYLSGRSADGLVVVMTSLAAAAFFLPALVRLRRIPTRRSAALLGIVLGQLAVAGQGYSQIGIALLAPVFLILFADDFTRWRLYLWRLLQAGITGALVGGIFLLPFARSYTQFSKLLDKGFSSHQMFRYIVLDVILGDASFYGHGEFFDMAPFPGYHSNYLGWAVVIFAVIGGAVLWRQSKSIFLVIVLFAIGALWIGSGRPFQLMAGGWAPLRLRDFGFSMRNPGLIAMMAAPAIIGLAAIGIDSGWRWTIAPAARKGLFARSWSRFGMTAIVRIATVALVLVGLQNLERSAQQWLQTTRLDPARVATVLDALETDELAWVSPSEGEWSIQMVSYDHGLKLSNGWRPWDIAGFGVTPPTYRAFRWEGEYVPDDMELYVTTPFGLVYHSLLPNQYATASSGGHCAAHGAGGHITVSCDVPEAGVLTVQESAMADWTASVDGQRTEIMNNQSWISVDIPAGASTTELRFRPWDFWVGLVMTIIGVVVALGMLLIPNRYRFRVRFARPRLRPLNRTARCMVGIVTLCLGAIQNRS